MIGFFGTSIFTQIHARSSGMDLDDFRSILDTAGVDVWMFIDAAIAVASADSAGELKRRRDGIVERLYAATAATPKCRICDDGGNDLNGHQIKKQSSPSPERQPHQRRAAAIAAAASPATPQSLENDNDGEEDLDPYGGLFDDEQKKILEIKEQLEEPDQVIVQFMACFIFQIQIRSSIRKQSN